MIVYCLGDAAVKRRAFAEEARGVSPLEKLLYIDSDEVICSFAVAPGRTCFAVGETPFGDLTVAEYVRYARALFARPRGFISADDFARELDYRMRLFGLKRLLRKNGRLGGQGIAAYRAAQLLARFRPEATAVVFGFDGTPYSRRTCRKVRALAEAVGRVLGRVYVSVSDSRFVPRGEAVRTYSPGGAIAETDPSLYRAHKESRRLHLASFRALTAGVPASAVRVKKFVVAEVGERSGESA